MFLPFRKITHTFLFNSCLFLLLIVGIQNSSNRNKVDFLFDKTVDLPIGFILGTSFISGTILGSLFTINFGNKN